MKPEEELPTNAEELLAMLLETRRALEVAQREAEVAQRETIELTATVQEQLQKLEKKDQQISELLRALRGKQRERIDPDQLFV